MGKIDIESLRKRGKFNASMCYKLLTIGNYGSMFGETAWNHIIEASVEMVTKREDFVSEGKPLVQMEHGKTHEYHAYLRYIQEGGNQEVKYFGYERPEFKSFHGLSDEFGCYPDGGIVDDESKMKLGIEIKCPYDSLLHLNRLKWSDQWDIRSHYSSCYTQIQANLLFTGAPEWHFISYDDRQLIERYKVKVIPVFPDSKLQESLLFRINQAVKEKYRIISEYLG